MPNLRLFALPVEVPRLQRATEEPLNTQVQAQVRDAFLRYLRERMTQQADAMGRPAADTQPVVVQAPNHAPVQLYVPGRTTPVLWQVEEAIRGTGFFDPETTLADSCTLTHEHAPLFLAVPPAARNIGVFVPAPTFYLGYFQAWLPPGTNPATLALPVRRGFLLEYPPEVRHAATLRHRRAVQQTEEQLREAARGFQRGTSLAQLPDIRPSDIRRCRNFVKAHGLPQECTCHDSRPSCPGPSGRPRAEEPSAHQLCLNTLVAPPPTWASDLRPNPTGRTPQAAEPRKERTVMIPTPGGRRPVVLPVKFAEGRADGMTASPADSGNPLGALSRPSNKGTPPKGQAPVEGPAIMTGVVPEMFGHVFESYGLGLLDRARPASADLSAACREFLSRLPPLLPGCFDAIQLYTDGSFFPEEGAAPAKAGFAVCVLARQEGSWRWAGQFASALPIAGSPASLGVAIKSSFEAELSAMVVALAIAVQLKVDAMLGYDNQAALDVAFGRACEQVHTLLSEAALSMLHLLRLRGRVPGTLHIPSHTGHPLNDAVDAFAKHAALRGLDTAPRNLHEAHFQGVLPWLWVACNMCGDVPAPLSNGALHAVCPPRLGRSLDQCADLASGAGTTVLSINLAVATYNCLTCASTLQRESLDSQFAAAGLYVLWGFKRPGRTRLGAAARSTTTCSADHHAGGSRVVSFGCPESVRWRTMKRLLSTGILRACLSSLPSRECCLPLRQRQG